MSIYIIKLSRRSQMRQLNWSQDHEQPIIKVPLLFTFPPVESVMKELTKLNSTHPYRIAYLGPRWADSFIFHKKYSVNGNYSFDQRKNAKNTSFFSESMVNNQFYKNEIFYRAFEGMNPTLDLTEQLIFQSRFEGGNLDCAVRISENQYDLFLRIDSNTRGNIYWFYFTLRNCKKGKTVKLNICNLTKGDTHYKKGLNPFVFSSNKQQWTQDRVTKVTFKEKKLRYNFLYERMVLRNFYELSFEIQFNGQEEVKFAYCVPYLYSDLMADLKAISSVAEIGTLGQSLTGVNIPMVMVGKYDEQIQKPVLMITGRIHPGESNSSIVLSRLMKQICFSQEARFLREKVITIIVPMINPDGVILGNSRCGASGKDLNRQFKARSKVLFPQVVLLKNLVDKISETHDIELYLDFHGHSRKKNVFMFGPDYNITQPDYYKCRVFPKILSTFTSVFRYYSCSYDIPNDKRSTARSVMLNDMLVPIFFTVESSLGFFHDYQLHRDVAFTVKKWEEIGQAMVLAFKEYFEGIEQYEQYLDSKRKAKKQIAEDIRQSALNVPQQIPQLKKPLNRQFSQSKKDPKEAKEISIFKLFEQIKELQQKRPKQQKKQKIQISDNDSDSHNSEQQFQKEKMKQFSSMVTDFVQEEVRRKSNFIVYQKTGQSAPPTKNIIHRRNKLELKKKRELKSKEEQMILLESIGEDSKFKAKRNEIRTEQKQRYNQRETQSQPKKSEVGSFPNKGNQEIGCEERERLGSNHQFLEDEIDFVSIQKRANKMNFRMFNFSKMCQNVHSSRYHSENPKEIKTSKHNHEHDPRSLQIEYPIQRSNYYNFNNIKEEEQSRPLNRREESKKHPTEEFKTPKAKLGFPSSFYRIKYHNNQRKKQENNREKMQYDFEQGEQITRVNGHKQNLSTHLVNTTLKNGEGELVLQGDEEKKMRLYAELRKFRRR